MLKQFDVFDAFTVMCAFLWYTDQLSGWMVFVPWIAQMAILFISMMFKIYRVRERIEFSITKWHTTRIYKNAAKKARNVR